MIKQNPLHAQIQILCSSLNFHDIFWSEKIQLYFPVMTQFYDRQSLSKYYGDSADALESTKTEAKEPRFGQLWDEIVDFFEMIPLMKSELKVRRNRMWERTNP